MTNNIERPTTSNVEQLRMSKTSNIKQLQMMNNFEFQSISNQIILNQKNDTVQVKN